MAATDTSQGARRQSVAGRPTQIVLLDDQPAVRAGVRAIVASEPDLQLVGAATGEAQLWHLLGPSGPDIVVLDLLHHGQIGLNLCLEIDRQPDPPAVILYSESGESKVVVAAALAGASAVVNKESPTARLVEVIRSVAEEPRATPKVTLDMRRAAAAKLDPADLPILSMRLAGEPPAEIGRVLGLSSAAVAVRLARMLDRLRPSELAG
jgi:DNA-binding NarL/FixJ family response regulator